MSCLGEGSAYTLRNEEFGSVSMMLCHEEITGQNPDQEAIVNRMREILKPNLKSGNKKTSLRKSFVD